MVCSTFLHCEFAQMWPQIACIVTLLALLKFWRLIPSMRSFSSSSHCTLKEENELKAGTGCQMYRSSPQKLHLPNFSLQRCLKNPYLPKLSDLLYTTQKLLLKTMIVAGVGGYSIKSLFWRLPTNGAIRVSCSTKQTSTSSPKPLI